MSFRVSSLAVGFSVLVFVSCAAPSDGGNDDNSVPEVFSAEITPNSGAHSIALDATVQIALSEPVSANSISYINSDGSCSGSLQLSSNNFTTCLGIGSHSVTPNGQLLTVTPAQNFGANIDYQFRITTGLQSSGGQSLASTATSFSTSAAELRVSEVAAHFYSNSQAWFEIHNPTNLTLNLSEFQLRSSYYDTSTGFVEFGGHSFDLPSASIAPGAYMVVRGQSLSETYISTDQVAHVKDSTKYPFWTDSGFVEIIENSTNDVMDYVEFGAAMTPTDATAWLGTFATALPYDANAYGNSIGRDTSLTDTDSATDWSSYGFATPGAPNDVTCTTDADNDGIPDCSEVSGSTFGGLDLFAMGARTGQPDIFVEIDYMESTNGGAQASDVGLIPRRESLQKIVDAFDAQGFAVHFDVGDLFDQADGIDPSDFDLGGGGEVPFSQAFDFDPPGTATNTTNFYDIKQGNFDYARLSIFHYLVMGTTLNDDGSTGASGLAELNGNDIIISMGNWGLSTSTTANTNLLINYQAGTIMHELGHNLGLRHGGNEDTNFKANHISVMNYMYALSGLPTIGGNEGDRYYDEYYRNDNDCAATLENGPSGSTANFNISYSDGTSADLDTASLVEADGLGRTGSASVDYDCDGNAAETNVNPSVIASSTWRDNNDWAALDLIFFNHISGFVTGPQNPNLRSVPLDFLTLKSKVGDDRGVVVPEQKPHHRFIPAEAAK